MQNATFNDTIANASDQVSTESRPWERQVDLRIAFAVLMIILSIAGFFGNSIIVGTILMVRDLRKTRNMFLVNLSISDLTLIALVIPFNIISVLRGGAFWEGKTALCTVVASVCAPGCLAAIWSNAGVAFNRYWYICNNQSYDRFFSPIKTFLWIMLIWIIAFGIHLPNHLGWGQSDYAGKFYLCTRETRLWSYSTFFSLAGIILPLAICFFSYFKIYMLIRQTTSARRRILDGPKTQKDFTSVTAGTSGKKTDTTMDSVKTDVSQKKPSWFRQELNLAKTLFRAFAVFIVAWLPMAILLMVPSLEIPSWIYLLAVLLAHGSTFFNPLLYFTTNDLLRKSFKEFLRKIKIVRDNHVSASQPETSRRNPGDSAAPSE